MPNICGIEISEEHAKVLHDTCQRIMHPPSGNAEKEEAREFLLRFGASRHNPHATFHGTASEYIKRYLPEKINLIKYF